MIPSPFGAQFPIILLAKILETKHFRFSKRHEGNLLFNSTSSFSFTQLPTILFHKENNERSKALGKQVRWMTD